LSLRLFVPLPLMAGASLDLPPGPARHAQVRRLQPGDALLLFNGEGGQWQAVVHAMGRNHVGVTVGEFHAQDLELPCAITLAVGLPATERMDWLVEKATELGAVAVMPLFTERCQGRLDAERSARKQAHWQAVAVAACEQCGRNRVPQIGRPTALAAFLADLPARDAASAASRWVLSTGLAAPAGPLAGASAIVLSGPEGGLSPVELEAAGAAGFLPLSLGPRVLRAETAPLALLAHWGLLGLA
jgi:16S rRNA (uracil1498-N3)-methyltransferase